MKKLVCFLLTALMVQVTVSCKKDIPVSSIELNYPEIELKIGERITLTATVLPEKATDKTLIWETSDATVATVADGLVTAAGTGLAVITARAGNKKAECKVVVPPDEVVDMGIVMTRDDGTTYKLYWAQSNLCETGLGSNPEEYGDYFAWGDTEPYYKVGHGQDNPCKSWRTRPDYPTITGYDWYAYKFRTSGDHYTNVKFSKYNTKESYGPVDNIMELQRGEKDGETMDDAARAILGGRWRMPTDAEWTALCEGCVWKWITQNGILGYQVTAKNGNSIFLPASGYRDGNILYNGEGGDLSYGLYWSSSLYTDNPCHAWQVFFYSDDVLKHNYGYRYNGRSVRPVWGE